MKNLKNTKVKGTTKDQELDEDFVVDGIKISGTCPHCSHAFDFSMS